MQPKSQPLLWKGAAPVACDTTWNPFDKAANVTLSGGNYIATASTSGDMAVRANVSFSTGKHYFEITTGAAYGNAGTGDTGIGIATGAANINTVGQTTLGAWLIYPSGNIYYNGSVQGIAIGAVSAGDTVEVAVDLGNKRIWARKNHLGALGNWNGTVGADPATNTSGFDISSLFTSAAAFPTVSFGPTTTTSMTANFGLSAFLNAAPSGFTGWCGTVSITTWNISDKSANITLSNGNLTGAATSSSNGGVRGTTSRNSGKVYVEWTCGATYTSANTGVGIVTLGQSLSGVGATGANAFALFATAGNVYFNGSISAVNAGSHGPGDVLCMAVDFGASKGWFRVNGGNWNGGAAGDPVAGTGSVNIAALFPGNAAYPLWCSNNSGNSVTINCGQFPFTLTAPSGFSSWG